VADHIRIGMGCEGQLVVRALADLLTSNVDGGVSGMARIGLVAWRQLSTLLVPRPMSVGPRARGRWKVMPTRVGFWWAARLIKAVTGGSRLVASWTVALGSERPRVYALRGVVRPRWVVRFARFNVSARPRSWGPAVRAACGGIRYDLGRYQS
jgi:hypothetical protein